ncbi:MAG: hypothetical protein IJK78_00785 [Bacteroidales bacterium]|nr:hypothetical protein [Bacteroidales bacterium]
MNGSSAEQHWAGRVRASFCKNHDSGGLVSKSLIRGASGKIGLKVTVEAFHTGCGCWYWPRR